MELNKPKLLAIAGLMCGVVMPHLAQGSIMIQDSSYYLRPALRVDLGELIDGYQANSVTEKTLSQGVLGYSESSVNLTDGTVKMYLEYFGGLDSGNLQTFGGFGERLTIVGGAGTWWNFGFAIDGYLEVQGGDPTIEGVSAPAFLYDVGLAVYEAGQVNYNNFVPGFNEYDPLFYNRNAVVQEIDTTSALFSHDVNASVFGSIYLESNYETFDIFTYTNMVINSQVGDGLQSYVADLMHTARYEQLLEAGVDAFSSSGTFLGLTTPPPPPNDDSTQVPEPNALMLFGLGIVGLWGRRRHVAKH